jgi:hypothetical protein
MDTSRPVSFAKNVTKLYLFHETIQKNDPAVMDVFWSWVTRRNYKEVSINEIVKGTSTNINLPLMGV